MQSATSKKKKKKKRKQIGAALLRAKEGANNIAAIIQEKGN